MADTFQFELVAPEKLIYSGDIEFVVVPGAEGEGVVGSWVHSGDYRRDYILDTPAELDAAGSYPLLVMMHGAGGSAEGLRGWTGMDSAATRAGYITVFLEGLDGVGEVLSFFRPSAMRR